MITAEKAPSQNVNFKEYGVKLGIIALGNLLCAIAFNGFLIPNHLLSGGVGGIAIMIHYITKLPTGLIILLTNLPIFIFGAKTIDKQFSINSFISMLALSFFLEITTGINAYININDIILASIFGGTINGIGMGLLFSNKTSQGGMDIIAATLKKKLNINLGTALLGFNMMIIAISSSLFGLKPAMYTIISMYIAYNIVDKLQVGIDTKKTVIIVSDKANDLADEITKNLNRGVTFLQGEGAYSKSNKKVIYCIMTSMQIAKLKEIIDKTDSNALMAINDLQEVKGSGFKEVGI